MSNLMTKIKCAKCGFETEVPSHSTSYIDDFSEYHNCEATKLQEAIARVRKWHYKATSMFHVEDVEICATCSAICPHEVDSDVYWPCDTIRALDNIGIWFRSEALDGEQ